MAFGLGVAALAGGLVAVLTGDDGGPDVVGTTVPSTDPARAVDSLAAGLGAVVAEVARVTGEVVELCLLLADEPADRQRGLMGVDDVSPYDGMVFAWEEPIEAAFFMLDTPLALTLTWWGDDGRFLGSTPMEPCLDEAADECPRYRSPDPFRWAVEVERGSPVEASFVPGSELRITSRACRAA